jgi:hypothetical protein
MSTLEAICADTVPLMNSESFFPEMMRPLLAIISASKRRHIEKKWFFFRGNFVRRLAELINHIDDERELASEIGRRARKYYDWYAWSDRWLAMLYAAEGQTPAISERNPSMRRILQMLDSDGSVPKEELLRRLRWAPKQRALAWTSFRKSLKEIAPDDAARAEVIYALRQSPSKKPRKSPAVRRVAPSGRARV